MLPPESPGSRSSGVTRRQVLAAAGTVVGGATAAAALAGTATAGSHSRPEHFDAAVPTAWFDLAATLVRTTPGFSPPVASRAFGYAGLTAYEAAVPGSKRYRSIAGALPGLGRLPRGSGDVHWPLAVNASLAAILRALFPTTSAANQAAIDALEASLAGRDRVPRSTFRRSVEHGRNVARGIFAWSTWDGGHEGYLRNFPPQYVPPAGAGLWVPTPVVFQPALQPFWGRNRCFALTSGADCPPGLPTPYSEDPASPCFAEAFEVYDTVNRLTPEETAIATFWSDDPGATVTPPGHSVSIATQILRRRDASLMEAVVASAKVGIAVTDAFIAGWDTKYRYNLLRPVTYIRAQIDPTWCRSWRLRPSRSTPRATPCSRAPRSTCSPTSSARTLRSPIGPTRTAVSPHAGSTRSTRLLARPRSHGRTAGSTTGRRSSVGSPRGRCSGEAVTRLPFRWRRETKRDHGR
jgi:hypothetical protein